MKHHNKTKNTGFTLVELMVTISILAIMLSIAVPSFSKMIKNNNIYAGTNELVSALILTRSEALKRSNDVTLCTSDDQTTCAGSSELDYGKGWVIFLDCNKDGAIDAAGVDCDNDGVFDESDQIIKVHGPVNGLNVANSKTNNKQFITYTFAGRVGQAFTLSVTPHHETGTVRQVGVSRTGRIRTCDPTCP